ncbi:MAG: phosphoenolpyruvate synthase [Oxalobacteraceae bacterium]|nr:phosphoenolpyruvate synthase [Oxalobacteraceae bacterium]
MSHSASAGAHPAPDSGAAYVVAFEHLRMTDVESVGGKNASLGEMISQLAHVGVRVPGGFATTAQAFRDFLSYRAGGGASLADRIADRLAHLDIDDVRALAAAGAEIRQWIVETPFQPRLLNDITEFYHRLVDNSASEMSFAVRSSATAEDLPDASFAGQQETFLNVVGIDNVLEAMKHVFASLYNDRAISYRVHKGFTHGEVALSAGVQQMVRSDLGASGVMFTIDTESGFKDVVFITSSYGLGETVVQGAVNPDEFYVHKPMLSAGKLAIIRRNIGSKLIKMEFTGEAKAGRSVRTVDVPIEQRNRYSLNDTEVAELASYAVTIEQHYGRPMDIEWGKDGRDGKLYILQARPETVKSQHKHGDAQQRFKLKGSSNVLTTGRAIGQKIGAGPVRVIKDPDQMERVQPGDVLVADMTDPNWEPVMKRAAAIVTNRGGRTCHAAIIARELGVPAVVGCGDATEVLKDGTLVTVSCAEGVATIAAAFWPRPVIVRLSDFKSNEYKKLIGGSRYEPDEENPMLGFRGAARYLAPDFAEAFELECRAMKRVRDEMGLTNVEIMVPFVRTLGQAEKVVNLLAKHGLKRGDNGLKLIMMCEIPSNAILAEQFLEFFDGFSVGSNDLTQLTLGLDRDSGMELLAADFDERDPAVRALLSKAIQTCLAKGKYVGICGQGPSDHPDFAEWLMKEGISSISLNPDSVVDTWRLLASHR